jgi:hypothetical protein
MLQAIRDAVFGAESHLEEPTLQFKKTATIRKKAIK